MPNIPFGFKDSDHKCIKDKVENNDAVEFECSYSGLGWLLFSIGMSAKPTRVNFICSNCKEIIESSTDSEVLKKYVGR